MRKPPSERTYRIVRTIEGKSILIAYRNRNIPILYDSSDDSDFDVDVDTEVTQTDTEATAVR